jgi:AraC-like DNA-binding protein
LIHVRKTLRDSSGIARNVTEVALDYGFMHLGRFSSEYKKMFGELPSATLKNRN